MNKKPNKKVAYQNAYYKNDEIDIFGIIETLFKFKLRIIIFSIIATSLGYIFYFKTSNSFELTTKISPANSSVFFEYFQLNKSIEISSSKYYSSINMKFSEASEKAPITNLSIFKKIIKEFNDYEEVKEILSQQKTLDAIVLSELDEYEKSKIINGKAKSFKILKPTKDLEDLTISILWPDPDQGSEIFKDIINLVLQNVKSSIVNDLNQIHAYLKFIKKNQIELLEKKILSIMNLQKTIDSQRIFHLSEQAELARSMGLKNILVTKDENFEVLVSDLVEFNYKNSSTDYLRGYEILDKERELLQNRTQEELLLSNSEYAKLKNEIDLISNDDFENKIKNDIDIIINDSPYDWVNYDLGLATKNPTRQSIYTYLLISFLFGLGLSSIFTLIYSSYKDRKSH